MKRDTCPRGKSVVRAARTGRWRDELTTHVAKCDACRESARVARWMFELAEAVDPGPDSLPDPHLVWLKARIRRRSQRSRRALLPIRIASVLSAIGLGALLALLPRETWRSVQGWLASGNTLVSELPNLPLSPPLATLWIPAGVLVLIVLLFTGSEA